MLTSIAGSSVPEPPDSVDEGTGTLAADAWYLALDQETMEVGRQRWRLHVMGIHATNDVLWIQLQPAPETAFSLVLKVGSSTTIEDVMAALRSAEMPSSWPLIVDVTRPGSRVSRIPRARPLRHSAPI